jgi:hypothetical protein
MSTAGVAAFPDELADFLVELSELTDDERRPSERPL